MTKQHIYKKKKRTTRKYFGGETKLLLCDKICRLYWFNLFGSNFEFESRDQNTEIYTIIYTRARLMINEILMKGLTLTLSEQFSKKKGKENWEENNIKSTHPTFFIPLFG